MFTLSLTTRSLRLQPQWESGGEKFQRHLQRLGHQTYAGQLREGELVINKHVATSTEVICWLAELTEMLEPFEADKIIGRLEVGTNFNLLGGEGAGGINFPRQDKEKPASSIGHHFRYERSVAYLELKDGVDFANRLLQFRQTAFQFSLAATMISRVRKAEGLISNNHEYGGALRILGEVNDLARGLAVALPLS